MAQSTQIASPDQEHTDAQRTSAGMDRKKKSRAALDSVKNRYLNKLLGDRGIKVKAPKVSSVEETSLGKITTIPKIVQRNMNEIEIQPILKNFAYVRILYDTMANEYFYEAIEPKLLEEESETLGMHVTKRGSSFTIRRFRENPFTPLDLVRFKTMSPEMMAYMWLAIENGQSMLICGGTASGKTTTLNAILLFIPPQMKIVSIEDTRELNLPHENWVPLLTRAGFGGRVVATGKPAGEIDMFDLLTAALRQRPQYMMIGEVRGPEAFVVFQAMATGKSAYTTFHADDVQAMVHRLENDPINLPRALVAALDIVLLQAQVKVGTDMTRRVKAIVEVVGTDPESNELITNSAYTWNPADDTFNYSGHSYVYEKISLARNWNQRRMEQEVKRRLDIFEYMKRTEIKNYRDVAKIVSSYYRDPEGMIKIIRDTLQAQGVTVPAS